MKVIETVVAGRSKMSKVNINTFSFGRQEVAERGEYSDTDVYFKVGKLKQSSNLLAYKEQPKKKTYLRETKQIKNQL